MAINFPPDLENKVSSKTFLKVGDGNSVVGVFKGDPETFYRIYEDGKYKIVPKSDVNGKFTFQMNVIIRENEELVAKLFQGNWHNLEDLKALHKEYNLEETCIKISQTGERQSKRISFMPMIKQKPDQDEIKKIKLLDAKPRSNQQANIGYGDVSGYDSPPLPAFDEIPF